MIARVFDARSDPGDTVRYLFSDGHKVDNALSGERAHVHTDQHAVGGIGVGYADVMSGPEMVEQIAAELRANAQSHGLPVDRRHIHHLTLALSPEETARLSAPGRVGLSDDQWQAIADDYLQSMGWAAAPHTVVRHGVNANGGDHVHVLLSDVTDSGRRLDMRWSGKRSQQVVPGLEERHGLTAVPGRLGAAAPRPVPRIDMERQRRQPGVELPRQAAERSMRAAKVAATSEADYVRLLRADGWTVRPRETASGEVTGYSVGRGEFASGAGRIGRDLSLQRLRQDWPHDSDRSRWDARSVWTETTPTPPKARPQYANSGTDKIKAQLVETSVRMRTTGSGAEFARISADLSSACAAVAKVTPGPEEAKVWAERASDVGRSAQTRRAPGPGAPTGLRAAAMMLMATGDKKTAAMLEMVELVISLWRLHQATRDRQRVDDLPRAKATRRATVQNHRRTPAVELSGARRAPDRPTELQRTAWESGEARQTPVPVAQRAPGDVSFTRTRRR